MIRERTDSGEFALRPPQVSVVIPTFNNSQLLPRALQSVLEQTFSNIEVLIIDDGSTDNTPEVVASFLADQRVRYIRHDINLGPSATRNTGIREARGDLVAFLDSDDWWDKEKLYLQLQALIDERYSACAARAYIVDSDGIREQPVRSSADSETLYRNLLYGNVIPGSNSSVIVRTSCFDAIGMFDEELLSAEDQDLWLRLAAHYRFIFLVDVRPLVYIDKRRTNAWMDNLQAMSQGIEGFYKKREKDILEFYRDVLPSARRNSFLWLAMRFLAADELKGARQYAWKAAKTSPKVDRELRRSLVIVFLSIMPLSVQRRIFGWVRKRVIKKN